MLRCLPLVPVLFVSSCLPGCAALITLVDLKADGCEVSASGDATSQASISSLGGACAAGPNKEASGSSSAAYTFVSKINVGGFGLADDAQFHGRLELNDSLTVFAEGTLSLLFAFSYYFEFNSPDASVTVHFGGTEVTSSPTQIGPNLYRVDGGSPAYFTPPVPFSFGVPFAISTVLDVKITATKGPTAGSAVILNDGALFRGPQGNNIAPLFVAESRTPYPAIPEPGSLAMLALGLAGFMLRRGVSSRA